MLKKYRLLIVIAFLSVFSAKMIISAAPVFLGGLDKELMNSVIMQIEQEHNSDDDSGKKVLKYTDVKLLNFHHAPSYSPLLYSFGLKNSFIDHFKRYIEPPYPSVPTPPPNFS